MISTLLTKKTPKLLTLALIASSAFACPIFAETAAQAPEVSVSISAKADVLIARSEFAAYRGWLKYLEFRVKFDAEKFGADSEQAKASLARLDDWTAKIEADPNIISKLRGVQEWAYESEADGSGQPFKINIPTDYSPANPTPVSLYCHGYSGNHMEHSSGWTAHAGGFDVAVLGRARGGFYMSLSEADVLDVVKYVKGHWNIDERRVRINGGSMGGFASFWLAARHPDIWASARPDCGFAFRAPISNLVITPVYSLHSKDDPVVSIALDDGPLKHLIDIGGSVTYEETNGFGHAVWDFTEGNARASEWESRQVRANFSDARYIDYTALDGMADKAWWAEVAEWGAMDRPAHFILNAAADNTLYAKLDNIARLRMDIANSPFDGTRDMRVSVNGGIAFTIPAPLPEDIEIEQGTNGWEASKESAALPYRLHTTGGAAMVYDGSPLLIVYGTHGTVEENAAMLVAATAASKSPNASWPDDDIDRSGTDKVSHYQNLYGNLRTKTDVDVTEDDLALCNVVIIGTEKENSVAAKLSGKLPAKFDGGKIVLTDGESYAAKDNALGLVYHNPISSDRLILWFASEDASFYKTGAVLPQIMAAASGVDLVIMNANMPTVVTAKAFNSRWEWIQDCNNSSLIPNNCCDEKGMAELISTAIAKASHADFGISIRTFRQLNRAIPAFSATSSVTHYSDIAKLLYNRPIYNISLTGAQVLDMMAKLNANTLHTFDISPNFKASEIDTTKVYKIAVIEEDLWSVPVTGFLPDNSEWTGAYASDAITNAAKN